MQAKNILSAAILAAGISAGPLANAALYTADGLFGAVVEDFESFDQLITTGPEALGGGVAVVSTIGNLLVASTIGAVVADQGDNGTWGAGPKFAGFGSILTPETVGSLTFAFAPAFGAGAFFNTYEDLGGPEPELFIEALGLGGIVLEAYTVTIDTDPPGFNQGLFFGIARATQDIKALHITGDGFVLDDLRVTTSPVPLPPAIVLMLGALTALGAIRRARQD